jgi:hypothetical protein
MKSWVKCGVAAGAAFTAVGVAFVAVSLFTGVSHSTWLVLDEAKGFVGFGLCCLAGYVTTRGTRDARSGAAAGALGGAIGGIAVPASIYVLAYAFLGAVRQYPFDHYDYLGSGAANAQEYLQSAQGHATVLGSSVFLIPVVVLMAVLLGGALGYIGGSIETRRASIAEASAASSEPPARSAA